MNTNIQQYFRYYLALILSVLLAIGVRFQAASLSPEPVGQGPQATKKTLQSQGAPAPNAPTWR
jgi:H+/Cl- antiporter ClcA